MALNALVDYLLREELGFLLYQWETAGTVRSGSMDRSERITRNHKAGGCEDAAVLGRLPVHHSVIPIMSPRIS